MPAPRTAARTAFSLVAARIVHDDDVAATERRDQLRFDIDPEDVAVDRAVQGPRNVGSVLPLSGRECGCSPIAEGSRAVHSISLEAPAVLVRARPALKAPPLLAAALRVRAVALVRHRRQLLAGDVAGFQKMPNRGDARRDASPAKPVLKPR